MNKILGLLLASFLFVPQAVATADKEPTKPVKAEITLCNPGSHPCIKGVALNGDAIDRDVALFLSVKIQEAYESGADAVILIINSPGGEVNASRLIHQMLTLAPIPVHCITTQLAASGAFWALEGCYERAMTKDAQLMTHEPAAIVYKPAKVKELEQIIEQLKEMAADMADDIAPRMKLTPKEFLEVIAQEDWWMDSKEAVEHSAIDVVVDSLEDYVKRVKALYSKKKKVKALYSKKKKVK